MLTKGPHGLGKVVPSASRDREGSRRRARSTQAPADAAPDVTSEVGFWTANYAERLRSFTVKCRKILHIVAGAKDRRTNKVSAAVVEGMDGWTLQSFVEDRVVADAKVYTDEHASWLGLIFHDHESVNHSKGEYVRGDAGTQGIESFWAMLKRAHTGTFHKISPKHMDRYVTEFAGRHNDRQADTLDRMGNIVRGMIGRRISYADLTAS